jgi:hypothetical protein
MKALKIENRKVTLTDIANSTPDEELHALQETIGGYIEPITIANDAVMIVNEEGLLKCLNQNALASLVARQQIVGTAVIVGLGVDADGAAVFCDCPERYVTNLLALGK